VACVFYFFLKYKYLEQNKTRTFPVFLMFPPKTMLFVDDSQTTTHLFQNRLVDDGRQPLPAKEVNLFWMRHRVYRHTIPRSDNKENKTKKQV